MDLRYFELHDILCETSIALEAGDRAGAAALVRKALRWIEADWLASPGEIRSAVAESRPAEPDDDDE